MKKYLFISFILSLPVMHQTVFGYCTVAPSGYEYISNVSLSTLSNATGWDHYADYTVTGPTCTLTTCNTITLFMARNYVIPFHSGTQLNNLFVAFYMSAWIDYNNNNVFDANEKLGEVLAPNTAQNYPISFNIPTTVNSGIKRMRVMLAYTNPGLNPCTNYPGEVEDYSIYISLSHPSPIISSNSPVCIGKTIQLNSSGASSYSWAGPNSFNSSSQNPSISSATIAAGGIYTVNMTGSNGCTASATTSVTVNNNPVPVQGSNSPLCVGGSLHLTSGGGSSYSWSGPNSYTSNIQNPTINSVVLNHNGNYAVTVTNSNGCTATSSISVIIYSNPAVTSSSNSPLCEGSNLQLNSSGGISYSWTGPNNFISNSQNPFIPAVNANNSGNYIITITNTNGCTSSSTVPVVVNSYPPANAGNDFSVCDGDSVRLHGSGGTSYSWTGPNGFTSLVQNPFFNSVTPNFDGFYIVTVTDVNGCIASSSVSMTVNPNPVITLGSNTPVCEGSNINLTASGGTIYSWNGPHSFISASQNPIIDSVTLLNAGTYIVTVTEANCSSVDSVDVQINPEAVINASSNSPVCLGSDLQFNGNVNGGQLYSWMGPNNFNSNSQNPAITGAAFSDSGNYTLTVIDSNNCTADTGLNIIILHLPVIAATINNPCLGDSLILHSSGGNSYSWVGPSSFSSSIQNPFIINSTFQDSGLYIVTGTDTITTCISSDTVHANVYQLPVVNLGNDTSVCPGIITLHAGNAGASFLWNDSSTTSDLPVDSSGIYSVIVTGMHGCKSFDSIQVTVNPLPQVSLFLSYDSVCVTTGTKLLDGESPSNGIFSGSGVSGNNFFPDSAVLGWNVISYNFTDSITECSNSAVDSIFVDPCSGIEELTNSTLFSLYPNPFNSSLTIENYQSKGKIKVELMTVDARLIRSWNFYGEQKYSLPLSDIAAGVYFLMMKSDDYTGFFRVVKQ